MKATAFASFGGLEVMRVMEFPEPQAGPDKVRVQVKAAGVQHFDCAVRKRIVSGGSCGQLPANSGK